MALPLSLRGLFTFLVLIYLFIFATEVDMGPVDGWGRHRRTSKRGLRIISSPPRDSLVASSFILSHDIYSITSLGPTILFCMDGRSQVIYSPHVRFWLIEEGCLAFF